MDIDEFTHAMTNTENLISEYQMQDWSSILHGDVTLEKFPSKTATDGNNNTSPTLN